MLKKSLSSQLNENITAMAASLKDRAAKGFLWAGLNSVTMQILNALFGIVLARKLTDADYGLVGMLTVFALVAGSLQDSGFVTALTNKKDATHKDYNSVFWFNIVISFCLYVILFFCAPLIAHFYDEPLLTPLSRYYFLGFFIASFSIVPRAILFRQIKQKELAIQGLISLLLSGIVGIAMVYNGFAYWGYATQTLVFNLSVSILSWYLSGFRPSFSWTSKPIKEMFGFSSKMLITIIFNQINNNIFSVVLGKLYTKSEVGTYSQANKWNTMGSSTVTSMVQQVAQPTFVQVGDDKERLCRAFSKMLRFTCFVCFPAMFGLSLIAKEFIVITITERWLPSANLMQVLCIAGSFLPIATLYFNMIISRGKSNIYMWNIIAQGCTILATILVVHYMGYDIEEMVWAYVCIVVLWIVIWQYFVNREIGFSFVQALKDILPFLLIAAGTMVATYFITYQIENIYILLCSRIIIAAIIYLVVLWIFGAKILKESIGYLIKEKNK